MLSVTACSYNDGQGWNVSRLWTSQKKKDCSRIYVHVCACMHVFLGHIAIGNTNTLYWNSYTVKHELQINCTSSPKEPFLIQVILPRTSPSYGSSEIGCSLLTLHWKRYSENHQGGSLKLRWHTLGSLAWQQAKRMSQVSSPVLTQCCPFKGTKSWWPYTYSNLHQENNLL